MTSVCKKNGGRKRSGYARLAPLGKSALIPHRLTLTPFALYASLPPPEAATLQHSPLFRATPRPGGRTSQLGATPRPDTGLFNNSAGLPPDESAPAPIYGKSALIPHSLASTSPAATTTRTPTSRRICSGTHLRSSTATTTTTPSRRHPTAPFCNATPPTNELLRHHIVVEALRVFPTTRSCTHPLTLLQHSPLPASYERALLHWPPSLAALSDTTLCSSPDSRCPRSPLLSVKHTTGECSCIAVVHPPHMVL